MCSSFARARVQLRVAHGDREHWSDVYAKSFVGASDKYGSFAQENPVTLKDTLCTIYHILGIEAHTMIPDRLGRPLPLVSGGRVVEEMLS